METRIRELESELDAETRRFGDICKNLRKSERTIKELTFAADEDKKNHERMQALIDQLQGKVKSYKKQIEEAEEIAALNLAKYRKVAGALGDAEASADANEQAMAMRKAMIKMETRIRELESELDAETRRFGDVSKNLRKSERGIKELAFAADEDRKNHERMQSLIDQLQGKVKSYKKQIEEAEEIAALNLAKYRKVAGALGDAEASADANEQAMAMRKARAKSASLGL